MSSENTASGVPAVRKPLVEAHYRLGAYHREGISKVSTFGSALLQSIYQRYGIHMRGLGFDLSNSTHQSRHNPSPT